MSRADYLGKQFFKIAQLTNSSICYKNTFLSPRSSVRIQLTILLHLPNFKLFVTSCLKYVGITLQFLSILLWKARKLNQKVCKDLWQWSWRADLDWKKKQPQHYVFQFFCQNSPFPYCLTRPHFQADLANFCPHWDNRRTSITGWRMEVYQGISIHNSNTTHPFLKEKRKTELQIPLKEISFNQ